jgi:mannose-6-phosphate isomerase-like protein (cupin superfamily)
VRLWLEDVERMPVGELSWLPLRRELGATGFGVNAYAAAEAGGELIEPHDETSSGAAGHEELYVVMSGRARFTVGEETFDAPAGTLVLVPVGTHRSAVAEERETIVMVVSGAPGAAMPPSAFEYWYLAQAPYQAGDYERAIEVASEGLADYPDHPLLHYNLACFCSLGGRGDEAIEHLRKAFEGDARTREWAAADSDLDAIRDRRDYPA